MVNAGSSPPRRRSAPFDCGSRVGQRQFAVGSHSLCFRSVAISRVGQRRVLAFVYTVCRRSTVVTRTNAALRSPVQTHCAGENNIIILFVPSALTFRSESKGLVSLLWVCQENGMAGDYPASFIRREIPGSADGLWQIVGGIISERTVKDVRIWENYWRYLKFEKRFKNRIWENYKVLILQIG